MSDITSKHYEDRKITVTSDTLTIRGYYFPWFGAKRVPLSAIRIITRAPLSTWGGRWRLWGSTTLEYWANCDMRRPRKNTGFALDIGYSMKPFITPDDPDGFERVLRSVTPAVPFVVRPDPLSAV